MSLTPIGASSTGQVATHAPCLPPEVLFQVYGELEEGYGDLARCTLVCQGWRGPAQHLLDTRETVVLETARHALSWLERPAKGQIVKHLILDDIPLDAGSKVVKACSALLTLWARYPEDGGYEWCKSFGNRGLSRLELRNPEAFPNNAKPLRLQIQYLALHLDSPETRENREISVNDLQTILHSSTHTLASLHLINMENPKAAYSVVQQLDLVTYSSVETLIYERSDCSTHWDNIINQLPRLKAITIDGYIDHTAVSRTTSCPLPYLESLTLIGDFQFPCDLDLLLALRRPHGLPALRHLHLPNVKREYFDIGEHPVDLLKELKRHSVALHCKDDD